MNYLNEKLLDESYHDEARTLKDLEDEFENEYLILHHKETLKPDEITKISELYLLIKIVIRKELELCDNHEIKEEINNLEIEVSRKMRFINSKIENIIRFNSLIKSNIKDNEDDEFSRKYNFYETDSKPYKIQLINEGSDPMKFLKINSKLYKRISKENIDDVETNLLDKPIVERKPNLIIYSSENILHADIKTTIFLSILAISLIILVVYLF